MIKINQEAGVDEVDFTKSMKLHEISIEEVADDAFKAGMMKVVKFIMQHSRVTEGILSGEKQVSINHFAWQQFLKDNGLDKE